MSRPRPSCLAASSSASGEGLETTWDGPEHYARVNSNWWTFAARLDRADDKLRDRVLASAEAAVRKVAGDGPFSVPSAAHVLRAEA